MKKSEILLIGGLILIIAIVGVIIHNAKAPEYQVHMWTPTPYTPRPTATVPDGALSAPLGAAPENAVLPTVPAIPTMDPRLLIRYEEERVNERTGKTYTQCLIKGNINSKGERIYHIPGSSSYNSTKIDVTEGERWFCTEYDAIQAGWHAPGQ